MNKSKLVRQTCEWVYQHSKHVKINEDKLALLATKFQKPKKFTEDPFHQTSQQPQRILLQLFIMDSLNFCFWPLPNFEYQHLATHIQTTVKQGITLHELLNITEHDLIHKIFGGMQISQADERARILRQLAFVTTHSFGGSFVKIVQTAEQSAVKLLNLLTSHFTFFQDHTIYQGHQIYFYKRAQILIGDIFAKYQGKGLGEFHDIHELTMYPDYRVPQILQHEGVLQYSEYLWKKIQNKQTITDRQEEAEIRAVIVVVVQKMKALLKEKGENVLSIELDWFLWQRGESNLAILAPHHRCLTIYY